MYKTENRVQKGRGVILCEAPSGESGKRLTLLLKERGKITASAPSARKPKSKLLAGSQLFTYADFVFFSNGSFTAVTQIDVIESFAPLRGDYDIFCCAAYFVDICNQFVLSNAPCDDTLLLLLKSFLTLAKDRHAPILTCAVFELKFLQLNGFSPEYDEMYQTRLSDAAKAVLRYVLDSPVSLVYRFTCSTRTAAELKRAADTFIRANLELNLKSRKLLDF